MSSLVGEVLRRMVAERADFLCEYCLLAQEDGFFPFQVDHIISRKHNGKSVLENLAYACVSCNLFKGSNIATISAQGAKLIPLFNPRTDWWTEHFRLIGAHFEGLTEIGDGTIRILDLNGADRIAERESLISVGRYPSLSALGRMRGSP